MMTGLLRRNYEFFAKKDSVLPPIEYLERPPQRTRSDTARNGELTLHYRTDDKEVALHSTYDPELEGQRLAAEFSLGEADLLILLGCGLGYHLEKILPRLSVGTGILIVERDPEIFARFLERTEWHRLLQPFATIALVDATPALLPAHLLRHSLLNRPWRPVVWPHGPSTSLFPDDYIQLERTLLETLRDALRNLTTLLAHASIFFENIVANLDLIANCAGIDDLFGRLAGRPVIIVSAGPSLDLNGHLLRRVRDRALILAVDTALKPLLAIGAEPHVVIATDPQAKNFDHLRDLPILRTILVGEPSLDRRIYSRYPGATRLYFFDEAPERFLGKFVGSRGILKAWGSVSTGALDLALRLGANPIIFVGQDLAYTGSRFYCRDTTWEERFVKEIVAYGGPEAYWAASISSSKTLEMPDLFGHMTRTTPALRGFAGVMQRQMLEYPGVRFINATEGGILGPPAVPMTLAHALRQFLADPLDLSFLQPHEQREPMALAQLVSQAESQIRASKSFLEDALLQLSTLTVRPQDEALSRLERMDAALKRDIRVYDLYWLLERQAVWSFEREMKRLQWSARGPGWLDEIIRGYQEFYETLTRRADWMVDLLKRRLER